MGGRNLIVYIMDKKTLFYILFVIKTRLKHHDLEGKMERKNDGTRSSEISAQNFFFFFFHQRANESVSFQRATKESEIFAN